MLRHDYLIPMITVTTIKVTIHQLLLAVVRFRSDGAFWMAWVDFQACGTQQMSRLSL